MRCGTRSSCCGPARTRSPSTTRFCASRTSGCGSPSGPRRRSADDDVPPDGRRRDRVPDRQPRIRRLASYSRTRNVRCPARHHRPGLGRPPPAVRALPAPITAGRCRPSMARSCAWSPRSRICTSASARCSLRPPDVLARPWRRSSSGRRDGCTRCRGVAGGSTRRRWDCPSRAGSMTAGSISAPTSWRSRLRRTASATRASRRSARRSSPLRWTGRGRCGRSSWCPSSRTGGWGWWARSITRSSTGSPRCRSSA